jgi:hypothetical protein
VLTAGIRSEPLADPNGWLDIELAISRARNTLARTTSRRMKVKDLWRSRRRR